jgi:transposase
MIGPNGVVEAVPTRGTPHPLPPNPEVVERARRRQFSANYKLRIVEEADRCTAPGQVGALLRREGLYSSHLAEWRRHRAAGTLAALAPRPRGRPPVSAAAGELARLHQENERLTRRLEAAEAIIEVQKKVSALLGLTRPSGDAGGPR